MKEHFEEQLKNAVPITQKDINSINDGRVANGIDEKTTLQVGDVVLYMMVETLLDKDLNISILKITENELIDNDKYKFSRMSHTGHMPVFILKKEEE